jgi:hypothetical protein
MLMIILGSIIAITVIVAYTFAFRVEERFLDNLNDFADRQLQLPIDFEVVSQVDSTIRFIRKHERFSIYYLREIMSVTEVYSANMIQNAPTGNVYKSHLIKMSIDTRSLKDPQILLDKLDFEVKNFHWNYFETKLDGNVYLIRNDDSIDIVIDVPMYSQGTWEKIRALIQSTYDVTNQL